MPSSARGSILTFIATLTLVYGISKIIYNIFFHPLRSFPGPLSYRASRFPYINKVLRGTLAIDILALHERYGNVVRVAPNELAFADSAAWKDIMGHGKGKDENVKSTPFYRPLAFIKTDIVNADREEHSRLRRQLAHGFSDRSMREQEPLIRKYVDLLIQRLHENCGEEPLDMTAWYNFTTFDLIGDLAFGEPFDCLENSEYHPWVKTIFATARVGSMLQSLAHFPTFLSLLTSMVPMSLMMSKLDQHLQQTKAKLLRRMEVGKERPDLIEGLLKVKDEWNMDLGKIEANSSLLIIAGSETTATALAGITYFLGTSPEVLKRLTQEVRSTFASEDEITITSVSRLTYMLACLDEALRMYPPVPGGLPRVVPQGGTTIAGHFVPAQTIVAIHHWAMYHNKTHFADPFNYHPERFLDDPRFADDEREALQPFSIGPRNCLGRNLAYAEMRLILARVIFNFDMKMADQSRGWLEQKAFNFWGKGPLYIYLTPVDRT